MRVLIFNVKYSPNLGDGIIAECLEQEIRRRTGWSVASLDLAGRTHWTSGEGGKLRAMLLRVLDHMPAAVSDAVFHVFLGRRLRRSALPQWRAQLDSADAVVFGGGQLIQDGNLNFPIKVSMAANACRERGLAMCLFAVGATRPLSARGQRLFETLLHAPLLIHSAARDTQSVEALRIRACAASLCRDPGLLAARSWPMTPRTANSPNRVGLCITHPAVLSHHSSGVAKSGKADAMSRYLRIARNLSRAGFKVVCFTNGAFEDEMLLGALRARAQADEAFAAGLEFASRSPTPEALARLIAGLDGLIGHRLHAAIVAYAYAIPAVGLKWDDKLVAFFSSVGLPENVFSFDEAGCDAAVSRLCDAVDKGIDPRQHAEVISQTDDGITRLLQALSPAGNRPLVGPP